MYCTVDLTRNIYRYRWETTISEVWLVEVLLLKGAVCTSQAGVLMYPQARIRWLSKLRGSALAGDFDLQGWKDTKSVRHTLAHPTNYGASK